MFSVNLDEALGMRRTGHFSKAYQILSLSPALCNHLTNPLSDLLRSMLAHARHFGTSASLISLNSENFQNPSSKRGALFNMLVSRILLTQNSQFVHKTGTLSDMVEDLRNGYLSAVGALNEGHLLHPEREWGTLDVDHFDLNTCLRETLVLFKSFLHALPDTQLVPFGSSFQRHRLHIRKPFSLPLPHPHLAHRRMTLLKGQ